MKTRIALLLLLIIGTVACYRPSTCYRPFRPESCELYPIQMNHTDSLSGLEHTDSMALTLHVTGQKVGDCALLPPIALGGELMATPPLRSGGIWEKPLVSLEIVSTQDFNEIPAGQSLKNKLYSFSVRNQKISVEQYLQPFIANTWIEGDGVYQNLRFQFTEIPEKPLHTFTIVLTLADGRVLEAKAENVEWK